MRIVARVAAWVLVLGALVSAQGMEMRPASEFPQETIPAAQLIFAAYAFAWAAILGYVFFLWRRLARVERDLADVRARLSRGPRP
jgi:CcmD family protein